MAQQVKALASKADNLSSIPRSHTVEENHSSKVSPDLHLRAMARPSPYAHKSTFPSLKKFPCSKCAGILRVSLLLREPSKGECEWGELKRKGLGRRSYPGTYERMDGWMGWQMG